MRTTGKDRSKPWVYLPVRCAVGRLCRLNVWDELICVACTFVKNTDAYYRQVLKIARKNVILRPISAIFSRIG
jgi:hypothetical protein